jgi:acetyl-CoA carboxylase biotin carboxylase subunit
LNDFPVLGIKTDIEFLRDVIIHPEFLRGNTFTNFIPVNMPGWKPEFSDSTLDKALLSAGLYSSIAAQKPAISGGAEKISSPWETMGDWEIGKK